MRLIDADALLKALQYNTKTLIGEIKDVNSLVTVDVKTLINYIEKMPTAYDVEAVVENVRCDCYTMGLDESQAEILVDDIRNGGKE